MIAFRHADPRFPFLWELADQPPARWHDAGEGPVHYLADTPDGAWAELLRHEEITDPDDLAGVARDLWAVEVPGEAVPTVTPRLPRTVLAGGLASYTACRVEARRLRQDGATGLIAPSAALRAGAARGHRVDAGLRPGPPRSGQVLVLFGPRPQLVGWRTTSAGHPHHSLLDSVRHLGRPSAR